jgi:acetylornithine deacetylase/succinyl-diaminopimelate desuccinylase-like protein
MSGYAIFFFSFHKHNEAMRILGLLFVCSLAAACTVFKTTVVTESFDGDRAYALVAEQMDFGPRIPGTSGHRSVGRWIETQLSEQNWRVEVQRMSYQGTELRTIIGTPNWETSGEPLLLGAHYDTRPHADRDPSNPAEPVPGANDGASGTAVLLELARVLGDQRFQRTV